MGFPKIVVASSGRAGSTMLYDALINSLIQYRFGLAQTSFLAKKLKAYLSGHVYDLANIRSAPFIVCKTHDVQENAPKGPFRYLFIYGDPLESALSVAKMTEKMGRFWFIEHQAHLRARGRYESLYHEDVLNYKGQLTSWLGTPRNDVLCIDYDELWDKIDDLSDFVGFPVTVPARRSREKKKVPEDVNYPLFQELRGLRGILKKGYESRVEQ